MAKYSLLIIDDEWKQRKDDYERLLGSEFFEFSYIENGNELEQIKKFSAHGFLLDMDLSEWSAETFKGQDLFKLATQFIGQQGPVFLVSSKWSAEVVGYLNNSNNIKVVHFISWNDDIIKVLESLKDNSIVPARFIIKNHLDIYYEREPRILKPDESIRLLQISDQQFGDDAYDIEASMLDDLLPQYFKETGLEIDLLLVSGDITYKGLPSEFRKAKEWFHNFCFKLFDTENYRARILLIPGNHDVNLKLNCVDKFDYSFEYKTLKESVPASINEHHFYGLNPFARFSYELTGNQSWTNDEGSLFFVTDRFLHWGIRFYHLNSAVDQNYENPKLARIPIKYLEQLRNSPTVGDSVYSIVLCHHGPKYLGFDDENPSPNWIEIQNFLAVIRAKLFLHGHAHHFKYYSLADIEDQEKETMYHMTSSLTLMKKLRVGDHPRGFSIIELERENGIVVGKKIRKFQIFKKKITEIKD